MRKIDSTLKFNEPSESLVNLFINRYGNSIGDSCKTVYLPRLNLEGVLCPTRLANFKFTGIPAT